MDSLGLVLLRGREASSENRDRWPGNKLFQQNINFIMTELGPSQIPFNFSKQKYSPSILTDTEQTEKKNGAWDKVM